MTRDEALISLEKALNISGDAEEKHWEADQTLCKLLTSLGYEDVVSAWNEVPKWYA